jgi:hypothetical protein
MMEAKVYSETFVNFYQNNGDSKSLRNLGEFSQDVASRSGD